MSTHRTPSVSFAPLAALALAALALAALLSACASSRSQDASGPAAVEGSSDILDLLTGFGESISKRNFQRAVLYLTPEDRARILGPDGRVPEDMQKALMALPLQRLTRMPAVRVEGGYLAGIYGMLRTGPGSAPLAAETSPDETSEELSSLGETGTNGDEPGIDEQASEGSSAAGEAELKKSVQSFFSAVRQKNWNAVLSLMHEDEKRALLDDKGRLKDSAKERLSRIDISNREALTLQEGKLTGVTLLLPSE